MTNKEKLGRLGEDLFIFLNGGVKSNDKFDTQKDLILNNQTVEIKTQNRHPTKDSFTIGSSLHLNNLLKCLVVDRLIFVEYGHTDEILVWEVTDRKSYFIYTTRPTTTYRDGLTMVGYPISKMICLHKYRDEHLASQMRELSSSSQFNGKRLQYVS
jgi:hypothetical protein